MKTYSLKESEIYNQLPIKMDVLIKTVNPSEHIMRNEQLSDTISVIKNRINQLSKNEVLDKLEENKLLLLNSREVKLPNFLPVLNINGNKSLVNITPYIKSNGNINPGTLFGLLQAGLIDLKIKENPNKIRNNAKLVISSSQIYSKLATKVVDKIYAVNINKKDSDLVSYLFSKFYLISVLGRTDDETTSQIAYKCCNNGTDYELIKQMETLFDKSALFNNIFNFFGELKKYSNFNKFNVRSFIENYTKMYGETTILSIDHLPTFLIMIFSAYVNASINKEFIILNAINDKIIIDCYKNFF